jgi:transcriptional regulator with XRE-family HTH domain
MMTPSAAAPRFAANLKSARAAIGLTQPQVAKRMRDHGFPWHATTVAVAESGKRRVYLEECEALAEIVGVPLDRMVTEPAKRIAVIAKETARGGVMA